jgi:hypothetical protein
MPKVVRSKGLKTKIGPNYAYTIYIYKLEIDNGRSYFLLQCWVKQGIQENIVEKCHCSHCNTKTPTVALCAHDKPQLKNRTCFR